MISLVLCGIVFIIFIFDFIKNLMKGIVDLSLALICLLFGIAVFVDLFIIL